MFLMVWYKLSVEKKMISFLPVRIHCQQDFRRSGSRSLNIFDTHLSLLEPILSIFFSSFIHCTFPSLLYLGTPLSSSLGSSLPCDRMVEGGFFACSGSGSPILIFKNILKFECYL